MRVLLLLSTAIILALASETIQGQSDCAGNACGSASMTYANACYTVTNTGTDKIKIDINPYGGISMLSRVLQPRESWKIVNPFSQGQCIVAFFSPFNANVDPGTNAPAPAPPRTGPRHHELSAAECASSAPLPNGVYTIKNAQTAIGGAVCLGFDTGDRSKVKLMACDQTQQRVFTFGRREDGCYFVRNGDTSGPASGRCLDSDSHVSRADAKGNVNALACNDTKNQRWKLFKLPTGAYNLINKSSGRCVDRDSYHPQAGNDVQEYDCNGSAWQGWVLDFVRAK
jgi:ricin-type beta-trefoil lectin protein